MHGCIGKKNFCGRRERAVAAVAALGLLGAVKVGVEVASKDRRLVAIKAVCEVATDDCRRVAIMAGSHCAKPAPRAVTTVHCLDHVRSRNTDKRRNEK